MRENYHDGKTVNKSPEIQNAVKESTAESSVDKNIETLEKNLHEKDVVIQDQKNKIHYLKAELNNALDKVADQTVVNTENWQEQIESDQKLLVMLLERESGRMKNLLKIG